MACTEGWETQKEILVILAHPDDPEFFLGASIARWVKAGHRVRYVLLTKGDKGANESSLSNVEITKMRMDEQQAAAGHLGVISIDFLDYEDGYLLPSLAMRREVVRWIRHYQPDILVTCDPTNTFPSEHYINHPDHRYVGQVVIDAVFPGAGNPFYFPDLIEVGYPPHEVEEVWMSLTEQADITLDVTAHWEDKIKALKCHASQIGDPDAFEKKMLDRRQKDDQAELKYEEQFRRIKFRRTNT